VAPCSSWSSPPPPAHLPVLSSSSSPRAPRADGGGGMRGCPWAGATEGMRHRGDARHATRADACGGIGLLLSRPALWIAVESDCCGAYCCGLLWSRTAVESSVAEPDSCGLLWSRPVVGAVCRGLRCSRPAAVSDCCGVRCCRLLWSRPAVKSSAMEPDCCGLRRRLAAVESGCCVLL